MFQYPIIGIRMVLLSGQCTTKPAYLAAVARKKTKKFYVVWQGTEPGIYPTWPLAKKQVDGVAGARYKAFSTRAAAELALRQGPPARKQPSRNQTRTSTPEIRYQNPEIQRPSLSVDAACSKNPGPMEYQGVDTITGKRFFHRAYPSGTNNLGEFLALVHGLAWCKQHKLHELPIYSDSRIAIGWVKKKSCKTTLKREPRTAELLDKVKLAECWLRENSYHNPILKWQTEKWGEIPADFGRK